MGIVPPPKNLPTGGFGGGGFYQQPQPNRKVLAAGEAPDTQAIVYTVPRGVQVEITSIHAYNADGATQTLDIASSFNGGVAYSFHRASMATVTSSSADSVLSGMHICLGPQWEIQLTASKSGVTYLITGIEWVIPTGGAVS